MTRALLALGGNVGDVAGAFIAALDMLDEGGARVIASSGVYRTPPWGVTQQPDFLNMAIVIETPLTARTLLALCLEIERQAGRVREQRWGPRNIDIDIIAYGDAVIDEPDLSVPHPRATQRAFVLVPLEDIAPDDRIGGETVRSLAAHVDTAGITRDEVATDRVKAAGR